MIVIKEEFTKRKNLELGKMNLEPLFHNFNNWTSRQNRRFRTHLYILAMLCKGNAERRRVVATQGRTVHSKEYRESCLPHSAC